MSKNYILARKLRKNSTPQEQKLWNILRNHQFFGYEFRRQYPIGKYIVDFICRSKKIIIEIDGGQHNLEENIQNDVERTKFLESLGYRVVRFWNFDIDDNIDGVYLSLTKIFDI